MKKVLVKVVSILLVSSLAFTATPQKSESYISNFMKEKNFLTALDVVIDSDKVSRTSKFTAKRMRNDIREEGAKASADISKKMTSLISLGIKSHNDLKAIRDFVRRINGINLQFEKNEFAVKVGQAALLDSLLDSKTISNQTKNKIVKIFSESSIQLNKFQDLKLNMKNELAEMLYEEKLNSKITAYKNSHEEKSLEQLANQRKGFQKELVSLKAQVKNSDAMAMLKDTKVWGTIGALISLFCFFIIRGRKLKTKISELESVDHTEEIIAKEREIVSQAFETIGKTGIVVIDELGKVETVNQAFKDTVTSEQLIGVEWDIYLTQNFKKESGLKTVDSLYKFTGDLTCDFLIESSIDKKTGRRVCAIKRVETDLLIKVGRNRKRVLDQNKFNAFDYLEEIVALKNSNVGREMIVMNELNYADDSYLYTDEDSAKGILENLVNGVSLLAQVRGINNEVELKVLRRNKRFLFEAFVKDINLGPKDLESSIVWNGKKTVVAQVLHEIEKESSKLFGATTILKNVTNNSRRGISYSVELNDFEQLKWISQEYRI